MKFQCSFYPNSIRASDLTKFVLDLLQFHSCSYQLLEIIIEVQILKETLSSSDSCGKVQRKIAVILESARQGKTLPERSRLIWDDRVKENVETN